MSVVPGGVSQQEWAGGGFVLLSPCYKVAVSVSVMPPTVEGGGDGIVQLNSCYNIDIFVQVAVGVSVVPGGVPPTGGGGGQGGQGIDRLGRLQLYTSHPASPA